MFKPILALLALSFVLFCACGAVDNSSAQDTAKDGVLIHITAGPENPHRALMALQMAQKMSEDKAVAVYLDINAVKIFVKGASDVEMEPFPSAFSQLSALAGKQIPIMACPGCMAVARISPQDLMDGVTVADKEKFFNFTTGRIVTLDY